MNISRFHKYSNFSFDDRSVKNVAIIGLSLSEYYFKNHSGSPLGPLAVLFSRFSARCTSAVAIWGMSDQLVVFGVKVVFGQCSLIQLLRSYLSRRSFTCLATSFKFCHYFRVP